MDESDGFFVEKMEKIREEFVVVMVDFGGEGGRDGGDGEKVREDGRVGDILKRRRES